MPILLLACLIAATCLVGLSRRLAQVALIVSQARMLAAVARRKLLHLIGELAIVGQVLIMVMLLLLLIENVRVLEPIVQRQGA